MTRVREWTYVADAGNHRVLGWHGALKEDRDADLVLGQSDFVSSFELPHRKQGPDVLRFPYGISEHEDGLVVADTANNRLLFWPVEEDGKAVSSNATVVAGQRDFDANGENHWLSVEMDTLCWPYGVCWHNNTVAVADSGNNRVMLWESPVMTATAPHVGEPMCATY
jgi:hypothetical protein